MQSVLAQQIHTTRTKTSVIFRLPVRKAPQFSLRGAVFIVISIMLPMAVAGGKVSPIALHVASLIATLAGSAWLALYGCWLCAGYEELEVGGGLLIRRLRLGRFAYRFQRSVESLSRIDVVKTRENGLGQLRAQFNVGEPFVLIYGYPPEWLLPLAKQVASDCQLHLPVGGDSHQSHERTDLAAAPAAPHNVPVVAMVEALLPRDYVERLERPPGCCSLFRHTAEGLRFEFPRRGLWHGNHGGLLVFGTFWTGIVSVITFGFLTAKLTGVEIRPPTSLPMLLLLLTPFWLTAATLIVIAVFNASLRVVLVATPNQLLLESSDLLGSRRRVWARSEVADVRVHTRSNLALSRATYVQLQTPGNFPTVLLAYWDWGEYRNRAELEWVATLLRRELQLAG